MKKIKRLSFSILVVSFCLMMMSVFSKPVSAKTYTGIGEKRFEWEREIYEDVNLRHTMSYNQNKDQKTYTVKFDPKTVALKPVVTTGPGTVLYGNTMSRLINHYESQGQHVVFGFNGDGYDTSNGVPSGIGINDGILLNSSTDKLGWGLTADGELKYGSAKLPMNFTIGGGSPINLTHVNKERKKQTNGVYLLTEDFYSTTESTSRGVEVVLSVDANQDGLRIGEPYRLTVDEVVTVNDNPSKNKTKIGKGKAVLATHTNGTHYNTLANLQKGQKITVNVNDNNDSRIDWTEIVAGMGIFHLLLDNGVETSALSNPDVHPRTVMGVTASGEIVMMQNDGRQLGWAAGFTFRETVEYLRDEFGCVTVFNFDGGGSSTTAVTLPGDERASILNRPSDGQERNNANAFLLIATEKPVSGKPVEKLHIYPSEIENNANKAMILENGQMSFNIRATDSKYYQVPVPSEISYRVENQVGNIGSVSSNGVFTANPGNSKGKIIASYNNIETSFEIEVVDTITSIERNLTIISMAPNATRNLEFRAYKDGVPMIASNEALNFELTPSTLGSVSSKGVFTAADVEETGHLIVSHKEFSLKIPVEIGALPEMILDFEEDIFSSGSSWQKHFVNMPQSGGSFGGWGDISINRDEDYIKHGDGSLRIDYDFATNPLTGTVAIEIGETGGTVLNGQPTAIGAWVYGDGQGGWFRIQLTGGKYAGSTRIDWVGWRYIETAIPEDAPFPYTVQRLVRLLGTESIANGAEGTIYVDSVRAIYQFKNDDEEDPVIESFSPSDGAITSNRQQVISLRASDDHTGVNTERTQMFINGEQVENLQQVINNDGSVDIIFNPSALSRLEYGKQNIRVRVEDNFGNKTFKEWSFDVSSTALSIDAEVPSKQTIYAKESFNYKITAENLSTFTNFDLSIYYNKDSLELLDIEVADGLEASINHNSNLGKVDINLSGMDEVSDDVLDIINFNFSTKTQVNGSTEIEVVKAEVTSSGSKYDVVLPNYDVPLKHLYSISAKGFASGSVTTITVKEGEEFVSGAEVRAIYNGEVIKIDGLTDENGNLTTNVLTSYPAGSEFILYAVKDSFYSNQTTVEVLGTKGLVTMTDGASIRIKTDKSEQGLRFIAKLDESVKDNEHGFYLVYGKTTVAELINTINNESLIINGKEVFHVTVPGVSKDNEFSVVLVGIPEVGYVDQLSAIAYVVVDGVKQFAEMPVSRSVLDVALKMHENNLSNSHVLEIINAANLNALKFGLNASGYYEVSNTLYELNHFNLRDEFLKDWNSKFDLDLSELEGVSFFESASIGSLDEVGDNKDLSNTNLYKFFNDPKYLSKWKFLLDFIASVDGTTHPTRQIEALLDGGTNEDYLLYNGNHISLAITNFFNQDKVEMDYPVIDFTSIDKYKTLKDMKGLLYINTNNYLLVKEGETVRVPSITTSPLGYEFVNYLVDGVVVNPNTVYTISTPVIFEPQFNLVDYEVKFYEGANEITSLRDSYNIEDGLVLPTYEKAGMVFVGWYDNPLFEGDAVKRINAGEVQNKAFYAKWTDSARVRYHLGDYGYHTSVKTKDDLYLEFVADYKTLFGRGVSVEELAANFFNNSYIPAQYTFSDIFTYDNNKYGWIKEYILEIAKEEEYSHEQNLKDYDQAAWRTQIEALFNETQITTTMQSLDFTMENNAHGFWKHTDFGIYETDFVANGPLFSDIKTDSKIYGFAGFEDKEGNLVTTLPAESEGLDLYARWERSAFYVRFNIGYNTSSPDAQLVIKDLLVIEPEIDDRAGYKFLGWYLNGEEYDFSTPVVKELLLTAKWELEATGEYNINYELDGGKVVYASKDELINGFLDDFYDYLGISISVNDFKHGTGKSSGYDGLWHSTYKAKIYSGRRPDAVDEDYFASSEDYMDKWLPFFDMVHEFVVEVNATQFFWDTRPNLSSTEVGLIRIRQYVANIKPANHVTDDTMAMVPTNPIERPKVTLGYVNVPLALQTAYKEGYTFKGWYLDPAFTDGPVTELNRNTSSEVTLYAKFE